MTSSVHSAIRPSLRVRGDGWAEGDTGMWFGLRADPVDKRDKVYDSHSSFTT